MKPITSVLPGAALVAATVLPVGVAPLVGLHEAVQSVRAMPAASFEAQGNGDRYLCPDGYFCIWKDVGYRGRMLAINDPGRQAIWGELRDQASSGFNRRRTESRLINTRPRFRGDDIFKFGPGRSNPDFTRVWARYPMYRWNDIADEVDLR